MSAIRTPDERFVDLPGFSYSPHYVNLSGLHMHYVDEGEGQVILCLHGEPTWSYLYRKMIPALSRQHRVVALDFPGFGRSDKLSTKQDYHYGLFFDTLLGFIGRLDLADITVVVHDWGGLIGLPAVARMPERFSRLVIMNTGLPTVQEMDRRRARAFLVWRKYVQSRPDLPIGQVMRRGMAHGDQVPPEVIAAYEAPFPDATFKAGAAAWPLLVPLSAEDAGAAEMRAARDALSTWNKPALVMFSDSDPITRGGDAYFRELIPTAKEQPEIVIGDAGHFLQEEKGEEIAERVLEFMERT